jgi:sugar diacid utilization regulator
MSGLQGQSANAVFRQTLTRLGELGVIPTAAAGLICAAQKAELTLQEAVLKEVSAFSTSANPDILTNLVTHSGQHIEEVARLFAGGDLNEFEFVRTHARHRAEQRFPLEAILHAYRCGHRVFSRWLREAALSVRPATPDQVISAVADFSMEYTNIISSITTAEYVAQTRILAEAESDRRAELLNHLLLGYDESDGRVTSLLKRAGYLEQHQSYCVVVVQSTIAQEMEHNMRVQRVVAAVTDAFSSTPIRTLVGIRNNLVTAVLADKRRQSGWTAPQNNLADRIGPLLLMLGPAVLVGISSDHPSTSFLPKAVNEAAIALDFAGVSKRVSKFSDLPIRDLLVHRGSDYVLSAPPGWVAALIAANSKSAGKFILTLRAIATADLNVQEAARALRKHPNTIYMRLERIRDITGLDGQRYRDLTELLLAADCWKL